MEKIIIDLEGRDKECAFFALYAGLTMYKDSKNTQHIGEDTMSIAGAEAYSMLQDLKKDFPKEFNEAKEEYEIVCGK